MAFVEMKPIVHRVNRQNQQIIIAYDKAYRSISR